MIQKLTVISIAALLALTVGGGIAAATQVFHAPAGNTNVAALNPTSSPQPSSLPANQIGPVTSTNSTSDSTTTNSTTTTTSGGSLLLNGPPVTSHQSDDGGQDDDGGMQSDWDS